MLSSGSWTSSFEPVAARPRLAPLMAATMFGYQGGESQETVIRKTGYRDDAKRQWSCLTTLDLSQIKNEGAADHTGEGSLQPSLRDCESRCSRLDGRQAILTSLTEINGAATPLSAIGRTCASNECVSWRAKSTSFIITGPGGQGSTANIAASIRREKPPFAAL
jgi:hypothetical protein